jgi:hypothetical protein
MGIWTLATSAAFLAAGLTLIVEIVLGHSLPTILLRTALAILGAGWLGLFLAAAWNYLRPLMKAADPKTGPAGNRPPALRSMPSRGDAK